MKHTNTTFKILAFTESYMMTRSNCMICHPSKSSKIAKIDAKLVKNCNCCPTLVSLFPWLLVRLKSQFITAFNFRIRNDSIISKDVGLITNNLRFWSIWPCNWQLATILRLQHWQERFRRFFIGSAYQRLKGIQTLEQRMRWEIWW